MAELEAVKGQVNLAIARLSELTGQQLLHQELQNAGTAPPRFEMPMIELFNHAEVNHPNIKKSKAQIEIQEFNLQEKKSELIPEVYFGAKRQFGNFSYLNLGPETRYFVRLNSRMGTGFSTFSGISSVMSTIQSAQQVSSFNKKSITEQITQDYLTVQMMQTRVQAIQGVLVSAQDIVNSVERQFNSGRKSWLELMNAAREMAQTQAQYFDTQIAGTLSSWRLYFIVNGQVTEIQAKYFSTKNKYLQDT